MISDETAKLIEMQRNIAYKAPNETIAAVVAGIDPRRAENIFAICGSGEQAFSLLEHDAFVTAIDDWKHQIAFAKAKKRLLEEGKIMELRSFYETHPELILSHENLAYLSVQRLENISRRVSNITLHYESVEDFSTDGLLFDKAYLSSVIFYDNDRIQSNVALMEKVLSFVKPKGLIYFANGEDVKGLVAGSPRLSERLVVDCGRTRHARELERSIEWDPAVMMKVE